VQVLGWSSIAQELVEALIVVDIAIMFLPFKNISKRGSLFAVGVCVVLSGRYIDCLLSPIANDCAHY